MIAELTIQRIALIESLNLTLNNGLNSFTGETGAGKSIVLDAIGLLMGNRASADLIRHGSDHALVEGLFYVSGAILTRVNELCQDWGLNLVEDGQCVVTRELFRSGRTVCRVNGRIVTVQMLRDLGERLVQQHGQHDQQGLMKPDEQMRLLDLYGKHAELLDQMRDKFKSWSSLQRKWEEDRLDEQERVRRLDILNFQIEEITDADVRPGEEEQLREHRQRLQHTDRILSALDVSIRAIDGVDRQRGIYDLLVEATQEVAVAAEYDPSLKETAQLLESAQIFTEEASRFLTRQRESFHEDPDQLERIEERLVQIRGLERKYGATIDDVLNFLEQAKRERQALELHDQHRIGVEQQLQAARAESLQIARVLHQTRVQAALQLSEAVQDVLRQLNMPSAQIQIQVDQRTLDGELVVGPTGIDSVVFLFSANRGEAPKPLQKIASGGELSRTLLALKSVLAKVDDLQTLIFDEIDAGVSGVAAEKIALQLRQLGHTHQVICVTHSPQVAAAAIAHYSIDKQEREHDTTTSVHLLDEMGRVRELARLLGSSLADETAEHHARALLQSYLGDSTQR